MPTAKNDGVALQYVTDGEGPTVVFCGEAGLGAWLWSYQLGGLPPTVETLVWEYRGTGRSDAPPGPYSVGTLVGDLDAVLADHGARSVHLVGAGLGGQVAVEYAREHGRADTLALFGTPRSVADIDGDALDRVWADPGDAGALRSSLSTLFAPETVASHPEEMDRIVGWRREDDADAEGWAAQRAALLDHTLTDCYEVTTPALVCHGTEDAVVDPAAGEALAEALPNGTHRAVDGGHCAFVESAQAVTDTLVGHLEDAGAFE
jgi:pimeloyl-ACP methyl ester carboxylesterase